MKKYLLTISIFVLIAAGCNAQQYSANPPSPVNPVACTQEAKLCPDGSYVSRTGPNCEFAACPVKPTPPPSPDKTLTSGITGSILIGPTCPVQRNPPDPNCADRPYQATVIVKTADGQKELTRFTSDANGKFKVSLSPGAYLLVPISSNVYPRGESQAVMVAANKFTEITISFDSGIR